VIHVLFVAEGILLKPLGYFPINLLTPINVIPLLHNYMSPRLMFSAALTRQQTTGLSSRARQLDGHGLINFLQLLINLCVALDIKILAGL
jgi:hypothetical protein